jgi:hypothetical protein
MACAERGYSFERVIDILDVQKARSRHAEVGMICFASLYGGGRNKTAFMTENAAVPIPIAKASTRPAKKVGIGFPLSQRTPSRSPCKFKRDSRGRGADSERCLTTSHYQTSHHHSFVLQIPVVSEPEALPWKSRRIKFFKIWEAYKANRANLNCTKRARTAVRRDVKLVTTARGRSARTSGPHSFRIGHSLSAKTSLSHRTTWRRSWGPTSPNALDIRSLTI